MADNAPGQEDAGEDTLPISLPVRETLPPPPEISYTRPSLGHAAPAQTPRSQHFSGSSDDAPTPMDNAAKMGAGLSAGITLAASVVVGLMIGLWIDRHYNHSGTPWGTLVMSLVGIAAGFLNLFRVLGVSEKRPKSK